MTISLGNKLFTVLLLSLFSLFVVFNYRFLREPHMNNHESQRLMQQNYSTDSQTYERVSLTRRNACNYKNNSQCYSTNKSLAVTFWGSRSSDKWIVSHFSAAFPLYAFDHIVFIYDNSSWLTHPNYKDFIWIHIHGQLRFWYLKRFILPNIIRSYKFLWILDDDAKLHFNPLEYECVLKHLNIPLSAPSRLSGPLSHGITRTDYEYRDRIGRWVDFVETGPAVVLSSLTWQCIYKYLDASTGTGWGLDLVWCNIIARRCAFSVEHRKVCAIMDMFGLHHESTSMYSFEDGLPELAIYNQAYKTFLAKRENLGPLAENSRIVEACRTKHMIIQR